jgi:hypothetical protein
MAKRSSALIIVGPEVRIRTSVKTTCEIWKETVLITRTWLDTEAMELDKD